MVGPAVLRAVEEVFDAFNTRDWERYRVCLADDFVLVDHRPAYLGTITNPDDWVGQGPVLVELAPNIRYRLALIHETGDSAIAYRVEARGTTVEGMEVENIFHQVALVHDGRLARLEFFPEHALTLALERFHEIASTSGAPG